MKSARHLTREPPAAPPRAASPLARLRFARFSPEGSPPFVRGHRLLGNVLALRDRPLETLAEAHRRHGPVVCLDMKVRPLYVVGDADAALHVLTDGAHRYRRGDAISSRPIREALGEGLLTTDGDAWAELRRRHQPSFRAPRLVEHAPAIVGKTRAALDGWREHARTGRPLSSFTAFMRLTVAAGLKALFDYDACDEEGDWIVDAVVAGQERIWSSLFSVFDAGRFVPTPMNLRYRAARAKLTLLADRILARGGAAARGCPIHRLLPSLRGGGDRPALDHDALRSQVRTMLVSAPENPSNALGFALALLSRHPHVERRLRREIDEVLGEREPGEADLARLVYTRQVIDETLRLYPGAWILDRFSVDEDRVGGYRVPADRMVILCPYFIHRDPRLFEDPERFDPDRFAPERAAARPRHHYLPFGEGPRNCVGKHLALLELTLMLPMLLQRYRFEVVSPGDGIATYARVTLRPRDLRFRLHARRAS